MKVKLRHEICRIGRYYHAEDKQRLWVHFCDKPACDRHRKKSSDPTRSEHQPCERCSISHQCLEVYRQQYYAPKEVKEGKNITMFPAEKERFLGPEFKYGCSAKLRITNSISDTADTILSTVIKPMRTTFLCPCRGLSGGIQDRLRAKRAPSSRSSSSSSS